MTRQIIEIGSEGMMLRKKRGLLVLSNKEGEVHSMALDQLGGVLISAHDAVLSKHLLCELSSQAVPVILTDAKRMPAVLVHALQNHHESTGHLFDQIEASKPLKKRLWQQIVRAKLHHQAANLVQLDPVVAGQINYMVQRVRSGDPDNLEATAARAYWPALMGKDFRRNPKMDGRNVALNFGYAIMRSTIAQQLVAAGLHPALGLQHQSRRNSFCLADDLIEPFRPVIDLEVAGMDPDVQLTPDVKRVLVGLLDLDLEGGRGATPVRQAIQILCQSLAACLGQGATSLDIARYRGAESIV